MEEVHHCAVAGRFRWLTPFMCRGWAVRGRSAVANNDQRRPFKRPGPPPGPAETLVTKIPGKTQGKKKQGFPLWSHQTRGSAVCCGPRALSALRPLSATVGVFGESYPP
ncbi:MULTISPECIES: hypothetical protein [Streptomyces]|uniref:hypothetical protein n=1 Tax=Streptomyces TaxID=1883 RepID=UPI000B1E6475|nr:MULTISPECIES: hypothetical protein [Streptomyces]MCP3769235.1 hypothetical protein [Streptomyces sp. MAR25Y5]